MSIRFILPAIMLSIGLGQPAGAHDIYSHLVDSWGNSCCHDEDCRPAPYRVTPTGVQMFVDGEWIAVPGHTIQYRALLGDTGESGGGHWCGRAYQKVDDSLFHVTQCAILPPSTAALSKIQYDGMGGQEIPRSVYTSQARVLPHRRP